MRISSLFRVSTEGAERRCTLPSPHFSQDGFLAGMLASAPFCSRQHVVIPSKNPINYKYDYKVGLQRVRPVAAVPGRKRPAMDATDAQQEVDIERLINCVQELQDKVEKLEAELAQSERRDRDRMVALRGIIKEALATTAIAAAGTDATGAIMQKLQLADQLATADGDEKWDSYRNSFTLLMSKGYLQTMEQLRDKLLATEWEIGVRPMALQMGVTRFEAHCAQNKAAIDFHTITALYEDPLDLEIIKDPHLRMQARSFIAAAEAEQRMATFQTCTTEAQRLAQQFSEGEFISKLLPDPIEHGLVDSFRKLIIPMSKLMGPK